MRLFSYLWDSSSSLPFNINSLYLFPLLRQPASVLNLPTKSGNHHNFSSCLRPSLSFRASPAAPLCPPPSSLSTAPVSFPTRNPAPIQTTTSTSTSSTSCASTRTAARTGSASSRLIAKRLSRRTRAMARPRRRLSSCRRGPRRWPRRAAGAGRVVTRACKRLCLSFGGINLVCPKIMRLDRWSIGFLCLYFCFCCLVPWLHESNLTALGI
ncbi:hypothetical protein BB8028_0001g05000 [Beauveria bassiana]|uniref:Uncharacterized protein n=1 Tax=Beauveria bassiana TaxID=176275 RepID=A0A2S7XX79_BEABA|nr:hypothetical protein BB8028_0001g05000 [Beauveria bassiana]